MPLLTIAFPTYKRAHRIVDTINDTLQHKSKDIEVIVCDNSEDYDTKNILENIKDKRFSYYRNGRNLGFCGNFKQCIMNANGNFVLIVSDEDRIHHSALNDILNIIEDNGGGNHIISEIISGVAYIEEINRYYVAPPKNKNSFLKSNQIKKHYIYKLLRSYISGFLFNVKIAKKVYETKMKDFENTETYFYFPFWILSWLSLESGGVYTYNTKPLILKTQNEAKGYIEDEKGIAKKLFSFDSEIRCFRDKVILSKNDTLSIGANLDAYNIYYMKNVILRYDKSITFKNALKKYKEILEEYRKYPSLSIIYFYYLSFMIKVKSIIKKLIRYKPKYKT